MSANVLEFYGFNFSTKTHAEPELTNSQKCFKGTLFLANLLFLIFGCVLAAVGSYATTGDIQELAGSTVAEGIIVLGSFIIVLSLLGCFSAWKESSLFLNLYFIFLLLFTIILFAVGIAVYVEGDNAEEYLRDGWIELSRLGPQPANDLRKTFQVNFGCCGLNSFNDSYAGVPCPSDSQGNILEQVKRPCLPEMKRVFEDNVVTAGSCAIAFSIVMVFGMVLVCLLNKGIRQKQWLMDVRKLHKKIREAKETERIDTSVSEEPPQVTKKTLPADQAIPVVEQ